MKKREGNRPDRRFVNQGTYTRMQLDELARRLSYGGSGNHKLHPGKYGFVPSINPRASKSVCDDLRDVPLEEASRLFAAGIAAEMISAFDPDGSPKYVWAVDHEGEVYEAKTKPPDTIYHGYRLRDDEEAMRRYIRDEWKRRWPRN